MGNPRNAESISICSIGTIRCGIPPGAQGTKRSAGTIFSGCLWLLGLPMRHSSGMLAGVIMDSESTCETLCGMNIGENAHCILIFL
jgi:hypothetical protein